MSQDEAAKQVAKLVYETALVESGFILEDPKDFATRVYSVVRSTLNVSPDAEIEDEDETEDEIEKEELQTTTEETDNMQEQEQDEVRDAICSCCSALALRRIPNGSAWAKTIKANGKRQSQKVLIETCWNSWEWFLIFLLCKFAPKNILNMQLMIYLLSQEEIKFNEGETDPTGQFIDSEEDVKDEL